MQAKLDNQGNLVITIPFDKKGTPSKSSGKSLVHASTGGNVNCKIGESFFKVGVNVYSPNEDFKPAK
jgi:hypothetical protein